MKARSNTALTTPLDKGVINKDTMANAAALTVPVQKVIVPPVQAVVMTTDQKNTIANYENGVESIIQLNNGDVKITFNDGESINIDSLGYPILTDALILEAIQQNSQITCNRGYLAIKNAMYQLIQHDVNAVNVKTNGLTLTDTVVKAFEPMNQRQAVETIALVLTDSQGELDTKTLKQSRKRMLSKAFKTCFVGFDVDIMYSQKSNSWHVDCYELPVQTDEDKAKQSFENAVKTAMSKLKPAQLEVILAIATKGIDALM